MAAESSSCDLSPLRSTCNAPRQHHLQYTVIFGKGGSLYNSTDHCTYQIQNQLLTTEFLEIGTFQRPLSQVPHKFHSGQVYDPPLVWAIGVAIIRLDIHSSL